MKRVEPTNRLDIREVREETAILNDGTLLAVFSITPIKFDSLGEKERMGVTVSYRMWLDSLTYPVQIAARTVNSDLAGRLRIFRSRARQKIKSKKNFADTLASFNSFYKWLIRYVQDNCRQHRLYYLVIPYIPFYMKDRERKNLKNLDLHMSRFEKRVRYSIALLERTGIRARRLKSEELINIYSSYFSLSIEDNASSWFRDVQDCIALWERREDQNGAV